MKISEKFTGNTNANEIIYQHGNKLARLGYQYVISFDTYLGDLPELVVDGSSLKGTNASVTIFSCNKHENQKLTIDSGDGNAIAGSFSISYHNQL